LPTFPNDDEFRRHQEFLSKCPINADALIVTDIHGWLRRDDALKLFELAYYAQGNILEIGCHQGLSTWIIAKAVSDSAKLRPITSIDIDLASVARARNNLNKKSLGGFVDFQVADAERYCALQARDGREFGFILVDHSHTYSAVATVCRLLPSLLAVGGFCLFHDFNDGRNPSADNPEYGVSQAVCDTLSPSDFAFYGIFGCTGLYRKIV
jgi:predicted O-methyltransferase YrrM